jgi:hypothetical protein
VLCKQFGITNNAFIQYLAAERKYLQNLTEPSPTTTLKSQYVQALNDLSQCRLFLSNPNHAIQNKIRQEWTATRTATNEVFTSIASMSILAVINQTRCHVDTAYSKLQNAESYVETLENGLNIEERWTATSAKYQAFYQANIQTNYKRVLDKLEWLVVMQLFELVELSCLGTGILFYEHI